MRDSHFDGAVLDMKFYRDWVAKRKQDIDGDKDKKTFFITVSREYGCEGYDLAAGLVEKIGSDWSLFTHKTIDEIIASKENEAVETVRAVSEQRWSFKDWFVDALVPKYLQSMSSKVFESERNAIFNLVEKGNCVILGAGAQAITHLLDPRKFCGIHIRIVLIGQLAQVNQISTTNANPLTS